MAGLTESAKRKMARDKTRILLEETERRARIAEEDSRKAQIALSTARRDLEAARVTVIPESKYGELPPVVTIPPSHDGRPYQIMEWPKDGYGRRVPVDFSPLATEYVRSTVLHFQVMTLVTRGGTHVRWFMPIEGR